jgi:hypothetical protein
VSPDGFRFYPAEWLRRALTRLQGVTSLEGPVEKIDGKFTLRIPLAAGGSRFVSCARGISRVEDGYFVFVIHDWMVEKLNITEGCRVEVNNKEGLFNIVGPPWDDINPSWLIARRIRRFVSGGQGQN